LLQHWPRSVGSRRVQLQPTWEVSQKGRWGL
jgi:hypothetical protein